MSSSLSTTLGSFTMSGENDGYRLLIRVVTVNGNAQVTAPVRELWAKRDAESQEINYAVYSGNSAHDTDQEGISLAEANTVLRNGEGGPWLRSLGRSVPADFAGSWRWFPTRIVRAELCIWQELKAHTMLGDSCYIIDGKNLGIWLDDMGDSAEEDDDEANWAGITPAVSAEEDSSSRGVEDSGEDEVMGDGEGIVEDADESQAGNVDDDAMLEDNEVESEAFASDASADVEEGYEADIE